ncbi:MAG: acetate--CoA ligase family protein [Actinomycetes bacterium]
MHSTRTLSESASKALLAEYGIPFAGEELVQSADEAVHAVERLGGRCAVKLCGNNIAHKTERGLVRLNVGVGDAAAAADSLFAAARATDEVTGVLVAEMVSGTRELIAGVARDEQFGPTVMLGVGGVLAEALADVAVRLVPVTTIDALEMIESLELQALLGEFRGEPPVDRNAVAAIIVALARIAVERPDVVAVDLNPLVVRDGRPVGVDALVEVTAPPTSEDER